MSTTGKKIRAQAPDVIIAVGDGDRQQEFECYKIVLAFASPYFDAMFSTGYMENESNRVEFRDMDPEEWKRFYEYVDPKKIGDANHVTNINEENAKALVPWFHHFEMDSFLQMCDDVLSTTVMKLSLKGPHGCSYDRSFWAEGLHETRSVKSSSTFESIIQMLQFACMYDLDRTRIEAEDFITHLVYYWLSETIDLFTLPIVKSLIELSLPFEEVDESEGGDEGGGYKGTKGKRLVPRGKSKFFWELLEDHDIRAYFPTGIISLEDINRNTLFPSLAYSHMLNLAKDSELSQAEASNKKLEAAVTALEISSKAKETSAKTVINNMLRKPPDELYRRLSNERSSDGSEINKNVRDRLIDVMHDQYRRDIKFFQHLGITLPTWQA